jgi:transposase-like protein
MKSMPQLIDQQVRQLARQKVRDAIQPGVIGNVLESEMNAVLSQIVNARLVQQRDAVLDRAHYQHGGDGRLRNGFKSVSLGGLFGKWSILKPVLRRGTPDYPLLGLLKRSGRNLLGVLGSRFCLRGTATRATAQELNSVFVSRLNAHDISTFSNDLLPAVKAWLARAIPAGIVYLFVDAIYLPLRRKTTDKQALLAALGLTADGRAHVLGFLLGDRESTDAWSALLKDLLARGLDRKSLRLAISDDHKAIRAAVDAVLAVPHPLCVVHKMRNARLRVAFKDRRDFLNDFKGAFWAESKDQALLALGRLQARWEKSYPAATRTALADADHFLRFMDQPRPLWTVLRTSNLIERFNRELRRRLRSAGALPGGHSLWKLVWSVSVEQEKRWSRRRLPRTAKQASIPRFQQALAA